MNVNRYLMHCRPVVLLLLILASCRDKTERVKPVWSVISESVYAAGTVKSGRQYQAFASAGGIIQTVFVREGDSVRAGTPLLSIASDVQQLTQENAALAARYAAVAANQSQLEDARQRIALQRRNMQNDQLQLSRQRQLWQQTIGTKLALEQKELAYAGSRAAYESAVLNYQTLKKQLDFGAAQSRKNLQIAQRQASDFVLRSKVNGLDYFKGRAASFEDIFSSLFQVHRLGRVESVDGHGWPIVRDELLQYVHRCITTLDHPITPPEIPAYLNDTLASQDFVAGIAPRIGSKHVRVVAIDGFPRLSFPGILGALDALPIEYRWHTRALLLDPEEACGLLDKERRKWRGKIRGWKDQIMKTENGPINLYAQEMATDSEEAMGVAASGDVHFCYYNTCVLVFDESEARCEESASLVVKTMQNLGFGCRLESINAVEAWRGSLPGDGYRNVRRVMLHTLNLADMMPITAVWAGLKPIPRR